MSPLRLVAPLLVALTLGSSVTGDGRRLLEHESGMRPDRRPNLLVVVLDDVGVDMISAYGEAPAGAPCSPMIDALAAGGLLFRNAWANPVCSPTRAQLLTGRHGFRTGVGTAVNGGDPFSLLGLPQAELTLAEALGSVGYRTAAFGKWHLADDNQDPRDPLNQGFDWFEGPIAGTLDPEKPGPGGSGCPTCPPGCRNGGLGYWRWVKSTNGVESCDTRYATSATVDDALAHLAGIEEPWFTYVAFNAIHSPFHEPPNELCPGQGSCTCSGELHSTVDQGKAMLEALDVELARLVAEATRSKRPTYVVVIGDNGTPGALAEGAPGSCFAPFRSKGTLFEGGINVPLIVAGPGIRAGESSALVSAVDLFATLLELAGAGDSAGGTADDSVSFVPALFGTTGPGRSAVYAESFQPNGLPFAPSVHERAVRGARFKLIRKTGAVDRLFDLMLDPCESTNLFPAEPQSLAGRAWQRLDAELTALGVG